MKYLKYLLFIALTTLAFGAQGKDYLELGFPGNVFFGMPRERLQDTRPNIISLPASASRNTNVVVLAEIFDKSKPTTCVQYLFIDENLRSIVKSIGYVDMHNGEVGRSLHKDLARVFVKQGDEKILRFRDDIEEVVAELWVDKRQKLHAYFIDTMHETTLVLFDPDYFVKNDFFVSPEEEYLIAPIVDSVKEKIRVAGNPIDSNLQGTSKSANYTPFVLVSILLFLGIGTCGVIWRKARSSGGDA